jgi:hypothetical protein
MSKLALIGTLIAALATPVAAVAGHRARPNTTAVRSCLDAPVFQSGQNATLCGPQVYRGTLTVWVRDPNTGTILPVPMGKWRTERPPYGP